MVASIFVSNNIIIYTELVEACSISIVDSKLDLTIYAINEHERISKLVMSIHF